jgi:hypothetical protein
MSIIPFVKKFLPQSVSRQIQQKAIVRAFYLNGGLAWQEIQVSRRQFFTWRSPVRSVLRVLKYAFLGFLRIFLGRSIKLSYAYTGEDRLIESLLNVPFGYQGFYVEVGCNEPRFISNTFLFYRRGWRGVCVDANERLIRKFGYIRPCDKAVCALVSDEFKTLEFIEFTNNVLSTADTTVVSDILANDQQIIRCNAMQTQTLTKILEDCHVPQDFDFLSVDAEEFDLQVLRSLDLRRFRPRLIIAEAEDFQPNNPASHPIYQYLTQNSYHLKGFILKNLYFVKSN